MELVGDYDIYLDLEYADGTPLWGQIARFTPGTHDWQQTELVFDVAKPVREIKVFVFLRKGKGTVWFDDLEVGLAPFAYRALRVMPNVFGAGTLGVFGATTMPARWQAVLEGPGGVVGQTDGQEMPIRFDWINRAAPAGDYTLRLCATDQLLGQTIEHRQTMALKPTTEASGALPCGRKQHAESCPIRCLRRRPSRRPSAISLAGHGLRAFRSYCSVAENNGSNGRSSWATWLRAVGESPRSISSGSRWLRPGGPAHPHPADPQATAGWWLILLPVERFCLNPVSPGVWVTVCAPAGTPAGQYVGSLTVRPKNAAPAVVRFGPTSTASRSPSVAT